jgi:hypothetical protein
MLLGSCKNLALGICLINLLGAVKSISRKRGMLLSVEEKGLSDR